MCNIIPLPTCIHIFMNDIQFGLVIGIGDSNNYHGVM